MKHRFVIGPILLLASAASNYAASAADPPVADRFTPLPLTQTAVTPVATDTLPDGNRLIDFGRDAFAGLRLTLHSDSAGQTCVVALGESRLANAGVNPKPPGSVRYLQTEIKVDAGTHDYVVPLTAKDGRRMPAAIGAVMPFRYVEIAAGPVTLAGQPVQLMAHYPFDDSASRFSSSDPQLNKVWELCKYTMKATSFCGVFVDGDRERLPYEADAYINQLGWYCCAGEYALPRYSADYLMDHATWPTEWIFHSIFMAWADYQYTGDIDGLRRSYDALKAKALDPLAEPDGLIQTTNPAAVADVLPSIHAPKLQDIVDWPPAERDGYEMKPVNTVVNAFRFRALNDMAGIAHATGHDEDAKKYADEATRVGAAINSRLFDATTGLYIDGEGSRHSSLHANMFALAFGLVPADRIPKVAGFVRSRGMACSVYGAQYLMEALYATGQGSYALDLMLAPGDRSWAHMANSEATMTMEAWDQRYKPNQDWTHAWGAAPANVIPRLLMGLEPLEPGFKKVQIRPQPGNLANASIDMPTIRGPIHEDFVSDPKMFTLNVTLPSDTTAAISVPRLGKTDAKVTLDGVARTGTIDGDFVVVSSVGPGKHVFIRR